MHAGVSCILALAFISYASYTLRLPTAIACKRRSDTPTGENDKHAQNEQLSSGFDDEKEENWITLPVYLGNRASKLKFKLLVPANRWLVTGEDAGGHPTRFSLDGKRRLHRKSDEKDGPCFCDRCVPEECD